MADKLTVPLQESILSVMVVDDRRGQVIALLLEPNLFGDAYREFARRIFAYHRKHSKAPGLAHLDDLVDDILADPKHRDYAVVARVLSGLVETAPLVNADYVLGRVGEFARRQQLKLALTEASEVFVRGEDTTEEVSQVLLKALRRPEVGVDMGVRLGDRTKALLFLESTRVDFSIGIPAFDNAKLGLMYGQILLLIAPKGAGKSWACVDIGKQCLMQRAKVVHYTLENSWQQTVGRYYQSFFTIPKDKEVVSLTRLELDDLNRLAGVRSERFTPKINLDSPRIRRYLGKKINDWGVRLNNLVVKEFSSGTLTLEHLEAHLEYLALAENFVPHVVLIDYPDLMKVGGGPADKRVAVGDLFVGIRGLLQRRHLCGFMPTQGNRSSWDAATTRASMVSEDASKVFTSDMVMLYSQTPEEQSMGMARLTVPYNRNGPDKFSVVISQNYPTGQWIVDSANMAANYWDVAGLRSPDAESADASDAMTAAPAPRGARRRRRSSGT